MSRATINPDFFTEDNFLALSCPARYLAAYLICRESVIPVFKAKLTMTKNNFGVTDEDIASLASVGITIVDGYWIIDTPYIYYDLYTSPTNDAKYINLLSELPESVKQAFINITGINDKIKRNASEFIKKDATPRPRNSKAEALIEESIELKEKASPKPTPTPKPETKPSYLEDITDEVAQKFADKYGHSVEVVKKEAFKCVNNHLSKGAKITDWNRAFHTWMSRGYDIKDTQSGDGSNKVLDLSHLGSARIERRNY